jgi:hypothetical protein
MTLPSTGKMFWLGVGAAVGLSVLVRLRAAAGDQGMLAAGSGFWSDVREGMREREAELRTALGIDGALAAADAEADARTDGSTERTTERR